MKFMFDYCANSCLWGVNGEGVLPLESFPISKGLMEVLKGLCLEYNSTLNWEDPATGFVWASKQIENFRLRAQHAYEALLSEIGDTYEMQNLIDLSLGLENTNIKGGEDK